MTLSKAEQKQLDTMDERLDAIEKKLSFIRTLLVGVAIGIGVGAVIFGVLSIKDFVSVAK